jgi:hypothetical protein
MFNCRENNVFVGVMAFKVPAAMNVVIQDGNVVFTGTKRWHKNWSFANENYHPNHMLIPPPL